MKIFEYLINTRKKPFSVCVSYVTFKTEGFGYHARDYFVLIFEPNYKKQFLHLKCKINNKKYIFTKVKDQFGVFQYTLSKTEIETFKMRIQDFKLVKENDFGKAWEYQGAKSLTQKINEYKIKNAQVISDLEQ